MQGKNLFATRWGIIAVGAVIGVLAALLQKLGNPANMGICVACFERDMAGALGLHRAEVVQYLRPEIIGFVLGSLGAALMTGEFRPRAGSSPIIRFVLGMFAMIGALVFLGCPWRAALRLAGGDGNALLGLAGLTCGIWIGTLFLKNGYTLGRTQPARPAAGLVLPIAMLGLLVLMFLWPQVQGQAQSGGLFYSLKGPGSQHAPLLISLAIGLGIGFLAQRSRFCTMGAIRDGLLFGHIHLLSGLVSLIVFAFAANLVLGQFNPGFTGQPVAHSQHVWNFAGMALAGGCPGRQLFLAGEGDGDAAVFVVGMIVGAAFAHNFGLAGNADAMNEAKEIVVGGLSNNGKAAVCLGILIMLGVSLWNMPKAVSAPVEAAK